MQQLLHKLKGNMLWKRALAVLLVAVMVCSTAISVKTMNVRADDDEPHEETLTISNFSFTYIVMEDGVEKEYPVVSGITLENGTSVCLSFDWSINNNSQIEDGKDYVIEYNMGLEGIVLEATSGKLEDDHGSYEITTDGKLILTLTSKYWNSLSNKSGTAKLDGEISLKNDDNKASEDTRVGMEGNYADVTVTFEQQESSVSTSKTTTGKPQKVGDEIRQYYTVTVTCYGGPVTDLAFEDKPESGLKGPYEITLTGGIYNDYPCNDLNEVASMIEDNDDDEYSMLEGDTYIITYYMLVDPDSFEQNSTKGLNNTFTPFYHTNLQPDPDAPLTTTGASSAYIRKPSVTKNGEWNEDKTEITWTITIDPGAFDWNDVSIDEIVDIYAEDLPNGVTKDDILKDLTKGDFKEVVDSYGFKTYTYTYTTTISDTVKKSLSPVEISNTVSNVKIDDYTYEAEGIMEWRPERVRKTALGQDGMEISWQTALMIPDEDNVKDLKVVDQLNADWPLEHSFVGTGEDFVIELDGEAVVSFNAEGKATILNSNIIKEATMFIADWGGSGDTYELVFQDAWIQNDARGKIITLSYTSTIMDDDSKGKTYKNDATMSYTSDKDYSFSGQGEWTDNTVSHITKTAKANDDMTMTYTVLVDFAELGEVEAGKQIILEDSMPEELRLLKINMALAGGRYEWDLYNHAVDVTNIVEINELSNGKILMILTLNQEMADAINNYDNHEILIEYVAGIKDPLGYYEQGEEVRLRNVITGTYGGESLGIAAASDKLKPQKPIEKVMDYTKDTAPYINFKIEINPSSGDMTAGDWLITEDTMGSALVLEKNTIQVYRVDGTEEILLEKDKDWFYTYDIFNNRIQFQLPDNTHLIVRYQAFVGLYYDLVDSSKNEEMTFENSGNTFSLADRFSDDTQYFYNSIHLVYTPSVTSGGTTSSITVYKFYRENGAGVPLGGSSFEVYRTVYNSLTGKYSITGDAIAEQTLGADENEWKIENLLLDNVYALVETNAKVGYQVNAEPYFFALRGADHDKIPGEFHSFVRGGYLPYENFKATGSLILTKQVAGEQGWTDVQNYLSFTVKKVGAMDSTIYRGSDFTFDSENGLATLELKELEVGTYEITETMVRKDGYSVVTTYRIDSSSTVNGSTAEIQIQSGQTTRVAYVNTYTSDTTSEEAPTTTTETQITTETETPSPKTGDSTPVAGVLLLGLAGLCGAVGLLVSGRRRSQNR